MMSIDRQLSALIQIFSLPKEWADQMSKMLEKDEKEGSQSSVLFIAEAKEKIIGINQKLQRLLDSYLEQDIEREVYLDKKAELMSEKKMLEERINTLEKEQTGWIEPLREWIKEAQIGVKIARDHDLYQKKVMAKKLFGSNLLLSARTIHLPPTTGEGGTSNAYNEKTPPIGGKNVVSNETTSGKNPWDALRIARQAGGKIDACLINVRLYESARTYFIQHS
ncbi:MAG: hypothetical protein HYZ69_00365 [Candidatus Colwellbacteria bacterium]|nr:hypothetical protein [Candidatus Colwellbacteria bacterium]